MNIWQRVAVVVAIVVLADFSIPDGCDCGPDVVQSASVQTVGG
jgi:hypothetical protein